jgi:hypothetical protein
MDGSFPYPLRPPHRFLIRVLPRVRPLPHPTLSGPQVWRLTLLGYFGDQVLLSQSLAREQRSVGSVQVDATATSLSSRPIHRS